MKKKKLPKPETANQIVMKAFNDAMIKTAKSNELKGKIKSSSRSYKRGCPNSLSREHSFETYGMPKGKMKCVLCGAIKSMKKSK